MADRNAFESLNLFGTSIKSPLVEKLTKFHSKYAMSPES